MQYVTHALGVLFWDTLYHTCKHIHVLHLHWGTYAIYNTYTGVHMHHMTHALGYMSNMLHMHWGSCSWGSFYCT